MTSSAETGPPLPVPIALDATDPRQFVSDASHELRTPLTSIRGYLDLYVDGGFREPGQLDDVVRRMQSEAGRISSLIENLLQLARLDEEQPLNIEAVNIGRLIGDVVASAIAAHPGREVYAEVSGDGRPASVDKHKIAQLVTVLVDNALTHAPDASVWVKAASGSIGLTISVINDGPGLSQEETERVFDRFYRGDPYVLPAVLFSGSIVALIKIFYLAAT